MVRLTPGDPAVIMVGGHAVSPQALNDIRVKYGLDRDPISQYMMWMGNILHGDLGESFRLKQKVSSLILARLPLTFKLIVLSTILSTVFALLLGILSARYKNSIIDYISSLIGLVGVSSPVFFSAVVGMLVFGLWLKWLPTFGAGKGFWDELRHLILPAGVLALSMLALTARMTRSAMLEVFGSDYIEAARAKGLPESTIIFKHALRNALIPVLTVASLQMGFLLVGSVLVEYTMGLGGLGSLVTDAIQSRDYPVIQSTVLILVTAYALINLVTDLLYAVIDPRIRYE
jgi:peptide/nickel transport system permease protein